MVAFVFFGTIISLVVFLVWRSRFIAQQRQGLAEKLSNIEGFSPSQQVVGKNGRAGFAIDEAAKLICVIRRQAEEMEFRVLPYSDLVSSEICENGETVTKTSRTSQVGGVLVGGALLGGVGAVIGGLSGKTKSSQRITGMTLRVVVNDIKIPVYELTFMEADLKVKKGGFLYSTVEKEIYHWHSIISVLIKQADADAKALDKAGATAVGSVADELAKLAQLKKEGVITQKEYDKQKTKLLA